MRRMTNCDRRRIPAGHSETRVAPSVELGRGSVLGPPHVRRDSNRPRAEDADVARSRESTPMQRSIALRFPLARAARGREVGNKWLVPEDAVIAVLNGKR
jgi:hypothetical protein